MAETLYFPDGGHEVILGDRVDAFRRVIYERLGRDAEEMFDSILADIRYELSPEGRDDYERIADGYRNMAVNARNELSEALRKPRLNRRDIEAVFSDLNRNL